MKCRLFFNDKQEVTDIFPTATTNNRLRFTDEQIEKANNVNLLELARHYGYVLKDKERKAYHANNSGGLCFYKDRNVFKHFGSGTKGGAIRFVMMEENLNFVDAVKRLLGPSYEPIRDSKPRLYIPRPDKKELVLPEKAPNIKKAYWYLVEHRGIAPAIVSAMMNEKKIYQDKLGNCVFIGYDDRGSPKYCAKRGTNITRPYKRDQSGSDKSYPFHIAGQSKKLYVLESPIDAMSHATLAMMHGIDWRTDHRISLGCLSDSALERFLSWYDIKKITFAFDNDYDGKKPVQASRAEYVSAPKSGESSAVNSAHNGGINKFISCNWGQEAAIAYARKYKEMGYEVAIHTPQDKDFNSDIVNYRRIATAREIITTETDYDHGPES